MLGSNTAQRAELIRQLAISTRSAGSSKSKVEVQRGQPNAPIVGQYSGSFASININHCLALGLTEPRDAPQLHAQRTKPTILPNKLQLKLLKPKGMDKLYFSSRWAGSASLRRSFYRPSHQAFPVFFCVSLLDRRRRRHNNSCCDNNNNNNYNYINTINSCFMQSSFLIVRCVRCMLENATLLAASCCPSLADD